MERAGIVILLNLRLSVNPRETPLTARVSFQQLGMKKADYRHRRLLRARRKRPSRFAPPSVATNSRRRM
jgi:hypothetical protein